MGYGGDALKDVLKGFPAVNGYKYESEKTIHGSGGLPDTVLANKALLAMSEKIDRIAEDLDSIFADVDFIAENLKHTCKDLKGAKKRIRRLLKEVMEGEEINEA